ncbi:cytochrome P450, partial [Streptomyces alfalfae]
FSFVFLLVAFFLFFFFHYRRPPATSTSLFGGGVRCVIEETLRARGPAGYVPMRFAVRDIVLEEGLVIRQGDAILISFAATGLDPRQHGPDARSFRADRPARKDHLAFGFGVHHCPGASLARLEAAVALPALFARFPRMRLARAPHELEPTPSFITNGFREIPVLLDPQSAA